MTHNQRHSFSLQIAICTCHDRILRFASNRQMVIDRHMVMWVQICCNSNIIPTLSQFAIRTHAGRLMSCCPAAPIAEVGVSDQLLNAADEQGDR